MDIYFILKIGLILFVLGLTFYYRNEDPEEE